MSTKGLLKSLVKVYFHTIRVYFRSTKGLPEIFNNGRLECQLKVC